MHLDPNNQQPAFWRFRVLFLLFAEFHDRSTVHLFVLFCKRSVGQLACTCTYVLQSITHSSTAVFRFLRFASLRFISFRFVSFRLVSFGLVSIRFELFSVFLFVPANGGGRHDVTHVGGGGGVFSLLTSLLLAQCTAAVVATLASSSVLFYVYKLRRKK